jgi:hypothetical protein
MIPILGGTSQYTQFDDVTFDELAIEIAPEKPTADRPPARTRYAALIGSSAQADDWRDASQARLQSPG